MGRKRATQKRCGPSVIAKWKDDADKKKTHFIPLCLINGKKGGKQKTTGDQPKRVSPSWKGRLWPAIGNGENILPGRAFQLQKKVTGGGKIPSGGEREAVLRVPEDRKERRGIFVVNKAPTPWKRKEKNSQKKTGFFFQVAKGQKKRGGGRKTV